MEKNNKLIAEFMGNPTIFNPIHDATLYQVKEQSNMTYHIDELEYHTSWDWLMPVVEQCLEKHNNLIDGRYVIDTPYSLIAQALQAVSLKETYNAVVEFIKDQNN